MSTLRLHTLVPSHSHCSSPHPSLHHPITPSSLTPSLPHSLTFSLLHASSPAHILPLLHHQPPTLSLLHTLTTHLNPSHSPPHTLTPSHSHSTPSPLTSLPHTLTPHLHHSPHSLTLSFIPSPLTSLPHTLTPSYPHHSPHSLTLTPSHPHHSSLPHTLTPSPLIPKPSTLSSPHHLTTHHSSLTPTQGLDNKLRKEVWRYLLNYFPFDMTDIERMEMRRRKEREYWTMKKQWQSFTEDQENRFTKWREAKQLISE